MADIPQNKRLEEIAKAIRAQQSALIDAISSGGGGGSVNSVTGGTGITDSGTAADPILDHDAHTGDVTGSTALTIVNDAVDNVKAADMPANTVKVNATGALADPQDLAVSTNTILGRLAGAIAVLTGTQVTTLLDAFTSTLKGLVPPSGGGTTNFLRADGTFAAPAPTSHASTHEDGGGDEIDVTNLSGLLADPQTPAPHPFILEHTFDSSTAMANPGAGDIRYNNAVPANVTQMVISKTSNSGVDIGLALSNAKNGDTVYLAVIDDSTTYVAFLVSSILSQPSHYQYFGSVVDSGTLPAVSDILVMSIEQFLAPNHASTHTDGTDDVADLVGDSGSGGTHGLAPAPAAGDAAAGKFLKADASWAIPAGGGGSITTTNINWVDAAGNDGTATANRLDLPWLTIGAALTAAASGDVVMVRPGTYAESGLTVPAGVALISEGGFLTTIVGDAAAVAHIITMSAGSLLQGFQIICPTTSSLAGVSHSAGTGTVYDLDLRGDGGTGSGDGIYKAGTGKIVGGNIRCEGGGLENLLRVDAAVLALDDVHVPQSTGTIGNVILTEGTGRFQGQGVNVGNTNVGDCIHVAGTSTCIIYSPNWFNVPIGGHLVSDGVSVSIFGGRVDATIASLLIDPALTGVGTTLTVSGTTVQPLFSFPSAAITTMALSASFHQEATASRNAEVRSVGADLTTGFPELGSGLSVGEGSPFSDGQIVFTSDSTASPSSDGSTLTDVSTAAKSKTSSTFTFQGTGAGNSLLWCTDRTDAAGVALKHWGVELGQTIAAVGGSFIFEIQTAASTWVEIDVMAVSELDQFRYANDVFLRASSDETIRVGVDTATSWAETTISGTTGYWMRARIASTLTTAPVFERMRLDPSHTGTNALGQIAAKGLAQWRSQLFGVGNVWGEIDGGGAKDATIAVGSGGIPTGWSQKIKKGKLDSNGDSVSFQFQLPDGLCTAFPLEFSLVYSLVGGSPVTVAADVILSVLVLGAGGVLIADSAGSITPVARADTAAEAFTSKAATTLTVATGTGAITGRPLGMSFGPYPIADYYEGDSVIIRLELDDDGTPAQDFIIWALIVSGVRFTTGGRL